MDEQELLQVAVSVSSETDAELIAMHLRRLCNKSARTAKNERDAVYHERAQLVSFLSHLYPSYLTRHPEHEEWELDWRQIVVVDSPAGQLSWHIHDSELPLFDHLEVRTNTWDGHTTTQKYERLAICGRQESLKDELLGTRGYV